MIKDLINHACDPDITTTITQLSWDATNKMVILLTEARLVDLNSMEQEQWMQVDPPLLSFHQHTKKPYNNQDNSFPLSSNLSVTTIHTKKSKPKSPTNTSTLDTPTQVSQAEEVVILLVLPRMISAFFLPWTKAIWSRWWYNSTLVPQALPLQERVHPCWYLFCSIPFKITRYSGKKGCPVTAPGL